VKKIVVVFLMLICLITFTGCGDVKTIDGVTYDTYGFFDEGEKRNPDIRYKLIVGNVIWSCILVETVVAPVYFVGFSLFEPVGKMTDKLPPKGVIQQ
jgi:hypothetical protein